jgi:TATA-binding protein-associated factor
VVAPVRETCAQALGTSALHMSTGLLSGVIHILVRLLERTEWEARHGGLLGLKYMLAARQVMQSRSISKYWCDLFRQLGPLNYNT